MYQTLTVSGQTEVCDGVLSLVMYGSEMARASQPGQFLMVKSWNEEVPFLMRPISINSVDREKGTITLLYKVVGEGTTLMSHLKEGDSVQVIGPLGHGFPIPENARRAAVIGRGMGIAPLRFLVEECVSCGIEVYAYLSAKQESFLFHAELFRSMGVTVRETTNPYANVTDFFAEDLQNVEFDVAYSCGSNRLGQRMTQLHRQYGFPTYISLEEHMACGIGACKGCVCKAHTQNNNDPSYVRVCKEGPVFDVERVME